MFHYGFKYLCPLYREDDEISSYLEYFTFRQGVLIGLKFALDLLNSLQILHDWFGHVYSDISPGNDEKCTWKLIDFHQSLPIEVSLKSSRAAGTIDYIDPKSIKTGIFTFASDIWSLGRLVYSVIISNLLNTMEMSQESVDFLIIGSIRDFEKIAMRMMSRNPSNRPTARTAITKIFPILDRFENAFNPNSPVYERIIRLCTVDKNTNGTYHKPALL